MLFGSCTPKAADSSFHCDNWQSSGLSVSTSNCILALDSETQNTKRGNLKGLNYFINTQAVGIPASPYSLQKKTALQQPLSSHQGFHLLHNPHIPNRLTVFLQLCRSVWTVTFGFYTVILNRLNRLKGGEVLWRVVLNKHKAQQL